MSELTEKFLSGASTQELINFAEDYIGNPVAFIDMTQNEPLFSRSYPKDDLEDKIYRRHNISSEEYRKDTEYVNALSRTGKVHIIAWPNIRRKRIICGSVIGDVHLGGIRLPDVGIPFESFSSDKIEETAKVLGMSMMLHGNIQPSGMTTGQTLLWNILNGKVNPSMLSNNMIYPEFPKDTVFCVSWYKGERMVPEILDGAFAYTPFDGGYVGLLDYEKTKSERSALQEKLADSEPNLLISVSKGFTGLTHVLEQLELARKAESYARQAGTVSGIVFFNEYRLDYAMEKLSEDPQASGYLREILEAMVRYDAQNNTDYVESLEIYLACNQDIVKAAEKLHIHKNTVFYRISRINTLFGIDLKQSKTLAEVYCALLLLRGRKRSS